MAAASTVAGNRRRAEAASGAVGHGRSPRASQCGYCTPGFVMLAVRGVPRRANRARQRTCMTRSRADPVADAPAIAPIVAAAQDALGQMRTDRYSDMATRRSPNGCAPSARQMRSPARRLEDRFIAAAASRAELAAALRDDCPRRALLAGGTDLGLDVTKRRQRQPSLISLNAMSELKQLERRRGELVIGAAVTYAGALPHLAAIDEEPRRAPAPSRFAADPHAGHHRAAVPRQRLAHRRHAAHSHRARRQRRDRRDARRSAGSRAR